MSDIKTMLPELSENQVKWLYRELRDSVIGADEPDEPCCDLCDGDMCCGKLYDAPGRRNQLRTEQLAALSSFFGVEGE